MSNLLKEIQGGVCFLTLNRENKHNALNGSLLQEMQNHLDAAVQDPKVRVLVFKAKGKHFSAGADLHWMQCMAACTEEKNIEDAFILAKLMHSIYQCPKPTLAMVQGCAFGGGAGIVAACDAAIAAESARFCFPEVQLGLIPAVISPFVVHAIGERAAKILFLSAEVFDAKRALSLNLVQHCVSEQDLLKCTTDYAKAISNNAPKAVLASKKLVTFVADKPIDENLAAYTAKLIAKHRVSAEGQKGLKAFLNKETPLWD